MQAGKVTLSDTLKSISPLMQMVSTETQVKIQWLLIKAMAYDLDKISALFDAQMTSLMRFATNADAIAEIYQANKDFLREEIKNLQKEFS